jgi:hypothetical protein
MYEPSYPLRVRLPVDFVRRIDRLIEERRVPFDSRDAFIADAVEQLLTGVEWGPAPEALQLPPEVVPGAARIIPGPRPATDSPWWEHRLAEFGVVPFEDPEQTALRPPADGPTLPPDESLIVDEPLFGLHNRDFPSFWALNELCQATQSGPTRLADFRRRLDDTAIQFAMRLGRLDGDRPKGHPRLTAGFPRDVDPHDRRSVNRAISRFVQVAVGSIHRERSSGRPRLHGPLFTWRLAAVDRPDPKAARIAPTPLAYMLFRKLRGLQVDIPHDPSHAQAFFHFLQSHVPGDRAGFAELLTGVLREESRGQLVDRFRESFGLSGSVPETNMQGYVSRAREWGLLSPLRGQYELTEVGSDVARILDI